MQENRYFEIGKIKEVKDSTILKTASLIKKGIVFDLGMEINSNLPGKDMGLFPTRLLFESTPEDIFETLKKIEKDSEVSSSNEVIISPTHVSTHIDALCHSIYNNKVVGKYNIKDIRTNKGWDKFGVETIPPIVGRGLLVDIAKYLNMEKLEDNHVVSLEEIKNCLKNNNLEIEFGDIICIRTGKIKDFWNEDYFLKGPGIGSDAAIWLANKGMCILCIDYNSVDSLPWKNFNNSVHVQMLYKSSIYIIEAINLEELSKRNILEFFFVCSVPKFTGCSGIWVNPVAVL